MTDDPPRGRDARARELADRIGRETPSRADRFTARLDAVEEQRARRSRRTRRLQRAAWGLGAVVGGLNGAWLLRSLGGPLQGMLVGVAMGLALVALLRVADLVAARRGARAWDPHAGRHRLFGDPSRDVHRRDERPRH